MEVFFVALFGLVLGSFIGALTWRIPRGINFLKGRSFCDNCKKSLPWFVNLPLFPYIFLKGKSKCCSKKISLRYPLIELISMVAIIFFYLSTAGFYLFLVKYLFFLLTLTIFVIDLENQYIPDELCWLILLVLLYFLPPPPYEHLFSGFLVSLFLLFIHLATKGRGMGLGDVKLVIGLGGFFSLYKALVFISTSFLTGGIVASILLLLGRAKLKQKIAFGPFLIIGFWIAFLI